MEPKLKEQLLAAAEFLRYLGKYNESNVIVNLAVICEIKDIRNSKDLCQWRDALQLEYAENLEHGKPS